MIQNYERRFSKNELYLLQILFTSFKIFGSAPFTIYVLSNQHNNKKQSTIKFGYSKIGSIYNFILLFFLIMIMLWIIGHLERHINFHNNKVTTMYIIGITISGIINLMFIISIYSIQQKKLIKYINVLLYLDKNVLKRLGDNYYLEFKTCLIKKFFLYILDNLVLIGISYYNKRYIEILFHIVAYIIGNIILQYVIILIFICKIYQHLNNVLLSLLKSKKTKKSSHIFLIDTSNNDKILKKIIFIRKIQRDLSEVLCNFSDFFSLSLLLSLFFLCGCSVFHSSNIGLQVFKEESLSNDNTFTSLVMFKEIYLISLLTYSVTSLMSEIKRTSDIVYKLVGIFFTRITVKLQLEQFSIELLHRKSICFTACGLFPLDNSLLTSSSFSIFTFIFIDNPCLQYAISTTQVARLISTNMVLLIECQLYGQSKTINNNST